MKLVINISFFLLIYTFVFSQNKITGTFPNLANKQIKLVGFSGFNTYIIDSVQANENGNFSVLFNKKDYGIGYLSTVDDKSFLVVLSGETIILKGESFALLNSIKVNLGNENQLFAKYASEHACKEQALRAWEYLENIYTNDPFLRSSQYTKQIIFKEIQRIKLEDSLFIAQLSKESYLSYYLPIRKLVNSVLNIAHPKEIYSLLASFRNIDYSDPRLYKSGMLRNVIESHFLLIENSGYSLDSVYTEMNNSIDILVENLLVDENKLNLMTGYLFKFLEKRSLFKASEYLALKLLNEQSCTINNDLTEQLEYYRAMKKGNIAPDFYFSESSLTPGYQNLEIPRKLSDLKSKYTAVVFGASWCNSCPQELSNIKRLYNKWKNQDVEVVFVSLDDNKKIFKSFSSIFPFISICDYQKWESPVVKSYHVFASPTIYLLDDNRKILLRPNSVDQLDHWIDWFLVQGNLQSEI